MRSQRLGWQRREEMHALPEARKWRVRELHIVDIAGPRAQRSAERVVEGTQNEKAEEEEAQRPTGRGRDVDVESAASGGPRLLRPQLLDDSWKRKRPVHGDSEEPSVRSPSLPLNEARLAEAGTIGGDGDGLNAKRLGGRKAEGRQR